MVASHPVQPTNRTAAIFCFAVVALLAVAYGLAYQLGRKTLAIPQAQHRAVPYSQDVYEQAFATALPIPVVPNGVRGLVVNHHLLAPQFIARALGAVATSQPRTVVLISPDHFGRGQSRLTVSNQEWDTPYGTLTTDVSVIHALVQRKVVLLDPHPFGGEHGVSGVVSFIKRAMPHARLVPILVKDPTTNDEIERLAQALRRVLPAHALVIGSFDFAHCVPSDVAAFQDILAASVLQGESAATSKLNIDSQQGLRLLLRTMAAYEAQTFTQIDHSNSGLLTKNLDALDITSYFTGVFIAGSAALPTRATVRVLGDISVTPTSRIALAVDAREHFAPSFHRTVRGSDVLLAGSPTPVSSDESIFERLGVQEVFWSGSPARTYVHTVRGIQVRVAQGSAANQSALVREVTQAKKAGGFVVAMVRWERSGPAVQPEQRSLAQAVVTAGAHVVVGYGPEPLPQEEYQGKPIFYSLGRGVDVSSKHTSSISLGFDISPTHVRVQAFGLRQAGGLPVALGQTERDILLGKVGISPHSTIEL